MFSTGKNEKAIQEYKTNHGRSSGGAFKEGIRVFTPLDGDHKPLPIGTNYEIFGGNELTLYDGKVRIVDSEVFNHELAQFKKRKKQIEDLADAFLDSGDSMAIKYLGYYYNWLPDGFPRSEADRNHLGKCIMIDGFSYQQARHIIENDIIPFDGRPSSITSEVQTSERFIKKLNKLLWIIRYVGIVFTNQETVPTPSMEIQSEETLNNPNILASEKARNEVIFNRNLPVGNQGALR